jgi:hypothetical protein
MRDKEFAALDDRKGRGCSLSDLFIFGGLMISRINCSV